MKHIDEIPGLYIQEDVISPEMELKIIEWLDSRKWSTVLPRRTQHFGYDYGYKSRSLTIAEPLNGYVKHISDWLGQHVMETPEQCIVNEYNKDQNIGKHIDKKDLFGPKIVSISLAGDTNFVFRDTRNRSHKIELFIPRRSMMIMSGDARNIWTHEIPKRMSVFKDGKHIKKPDNYRRISLTYRTVNK